MRPEIKVALGIIPRFRCAIEVYMALKLFSKAKNTEARAAVMTPLAQGAARASIGDIIKSPEPLLIKFFGRGVDGVSEVVTIETALHVPAIWFAVNFLSRIIASLPIKACKIAETGREAITGDNVSLVLNEAANNETNAFKFRHGFWIDYFTADRGLAFVDKNGRGEVANLWPLEPGKTTVQRRTGKPNTIIRAI